MKGVRNSLRTFGLFAFLFAGASTKAVRAAGARDDSRLTLSVAAGNPAPSWIGATAGIQFNETLQLVGGLGWFWLDELKIRSVGAGVRVHVLKGAFTPMFGAGFAYLSLEGRGSIQGLDESAFLGTLMTGLDWIIGDHLRVAAGVNFHYPLSLNFPFLEIGIVL